VRQQVERCDLADDLSVSRVLTGLWQIADMERDGRAVDLEATATSMGSYVEAGLTTFDMADHYGSAELIAGQFLENTDTPDQVQVFTKWVPEPGPISRKDVRDAVQRSLDRLQTDRIDLLQFHTWHYADPVWLDALFWLQELREEGLIRYLGLTNFDTAHLRIALHSGIDIVSNQVCFSLIDQRPKNTMVDLCLEHDVKLLAYGTLAGGFLTERWLNRPEPDPGDPLTYSQMKYRRFIEAAGGWEVFQQLLDVLKDVAQRTGASMANVASRYILDQPAVCGVIVGARLGESEHIEDNLRLFQLELDERSREMIEDALSLMGSIPGDCGDEYRNPPYLTASGDLSDHLDSLPKPWEPEPGAAGRMRLSTGTSWETMAGYSRAVRVGSRIVVSGTTSTHRDRLIGGADAAAQMHFVIDKIAGTLQSLDSSLDDVIRTRVYVRNLADWETVARVHGKRFGETRPSNTLIRADLVGNSYLVEMEAEAVVTSSDR